jgi:hypothetical protein
VRVRAGAGRSDISDDEVLALLLEANEKLLRDKKANGLLLLLDELGKFLEYAAHNPKGQDIFLLQRLAELACRPASAPLFVVGMLHQGFDAYAEALDPLAQREWEKVAGRFEELIFSQPLLQVSQLIAAALRVKTQSLPPYARDEAATGWQAVFELGWMGTEHRKPIDTSLAAKLYPLHGTVIAPMVKTFARLGQNERSLFSFLLSDEPRGLQQHATHTIAPGRMFRLPELYDYIRSNFGHRLALQSYRSHWPQIESMVESFATSDVTELKVVKTVGVLNLLDHPDLVPDDASIEKALCGHGGQSSKLVRQALDSLQKRRVLFRRGIAGGYCLWPHTSVDLESAYERATRALGPVSVAAHLAGYLPAHSLVARRHYIDTGNLRFFPVRYVRAEEITGAVEKHCDGDGQIFVVLCESPEEIETAEAVATSANLKLRRDLLVAVPNEPLSHQAGLVAEVLRWEWVATHTPELNADRFAREELSRQRGNAQLRLEQRIQDLVGLRSLGGARALRWFVRGNRVDIADSRSLLTQLSLICDRLYPKAPIVKHELLNRHSLSSAAARARILLIEGALLRSHEPLFGMDASKKPPEMSMYMSVLKEGRLHVEAGNGFALQVPRSEEDLLRFAPTFDAIRGFLEGRSGERASVVDLLSMLSRPPYGVRQGLAPLLLALFTAMNMQELAFYEDGAFLREMSPAEFLRLTKNPATFSVQLCRIAGLRAEVFDSILKVLGLRHQRLTKEPLVLDVVRPLCVFVANLPEYSRNSKRLSTMAQQVRSSILSSQDPVLLLFSDLPRSCGLAPFAPDEQVDQERAQEFASLLKQTLEELRSSFSSLLERMRNILLTEFNASGELAGVRLQLRSRASAIALHVAEPRLKAFALRLMDTTLAVEPWLESLGSLVATQPPSRWRDSDEDTFVREIHSLAKRFTDVEGMVFESPAGGDAREAYKLAVTRQDGQESQSVVYVDRERAEEVEALAAKIQQLVSGDRSVGLAALSRATWETLEKK